MDRAPAAPHTERGTSSPREQGIFGSSKPLAAIVLLGGRAAGFQSGIYHGRGASGALYIQEIVFFRAGHVPVGVGDLVGLGGRL